MGRISGSIQKCGWLLVALAATACKSDGEATVSLPREPIARGAYYPLSVRDSCNGRGGGKAPSFCTSEELVSVDSFSVADPRIARVTRMSDLSEAEQVAGAELVIDATATGTTDVTIETTFDDDSKRSVTASITVLETDRLQLVHFCPVDEPDNEWLFPAGREVQLTAGLFHGDEALQGEYQGTLLKGADLERKFGGFKTNSLVYTPGKASTLTSPLVPGFSQPLRGYSSDEVTIEATTLKFGNKVSYQQFVGYDVDLRVGGERPCAYPALRLETQTPDICAGKDNASSWLEETPDHGVSVRGLKSGVCQFTVTVEGATTSYGVELELEVTGVPVPVVDPCDGVACEPLESCPAGNELTKRGCCNECVPLANPELCEEQRSEFDALYEQEHQKALPCELDSDCSQVVLAGGCRRYCFVPVNHERTADFMNAISEQYYTSCPSCQPDGVVGECEGSFRGICKAGSCSLIPL